MGGESLEVEDDVDKNRIAAVIRTVAFLSDSKRLY
jgi:hypothetical protein